MRIIDYFTKYFCKEIKPNTIIFGQNITTGSRIVGLTNNIEKIKKIEIFKSFFDIIEDVFGQLIEKNLSLCLMFSSLLGL